MFEGLEKRVGKKGNISYWDGDIIVGKRCTKCGKDKEINEFYVRDKNKNIYKSECIECNKAHYEENKEKITERKKEYLEKNKEKIAERQRKYREKNKEKIKERSKKYNTENREIIRQKGKEYYKKNKEKRNEYLKQWREKNAEYIKQKNKQRYEENKEENKKRCKEYRTKNREELLIKGRQRYAENRERYCEIVKKGNIERKKKNLNEISELLDLINPLFKQFDLPIYGSIYKITHKNGHCYVGQTIQPLKERYRGGIIKGWMKERKTKQSQKFLEEINDENDFNIEIIDVGCCQYHLDKMEAYYINKFDSHNNGYNNNAGRHDTNDYIEEFKQILLEHNLEFINGELRRIV